MKARAVLALLASACLGAAAAAQGAAPEEVVTAQGMRIWSFPDDGGDRFVIAALVGVGSRDELEGRTGIAHYLEHVLFGAAGMRPKAAADRELAARGIEWNGFTTHECTVYHLSASPADWQFAVAWLADHLVSPAFANDDVEAERRIVREEVRTRQPHAGAVTYEKLLYRDHALGRSVGGDPAHLDAIDAAALRAFWSAHYRSDNVAVGFAGRAPRAECIASIRNAFDALAGAGGAAGAAGAGDTAVEPRRGRFTFGELAPVGAPAWLAAGWHLPAASARDLALVRVVADYLDRRAFMEIREKRQLAYAPAARVVEHRDTARVELAVDVGDSDNLGAVLDVARELAQELAAPDAEQVARSARAVGDAFTANGGRALGEAMELAWLLRRRDEAPAALVDAAAGITVADVAAYAREHVGADPHFVVSSAPIGSQVAWVGWGLALLLLLLFVDGFSGFMRTRALGAAIAVLVRRRPKRVAPVRSLMRREPVRPVDGDELERSIQQYLADEERERGPRGEDEPDR